MKFVKRMGPSFNHFVEEPTPTFTAWFNQHFWRTEVYSPYFDNKTSFYPHGWVYRDLYAIFPGSSFAHEHEAFILRNAAGHPLYIPWGCSGGSCPQYAADVGNPAYRHEWIAEAKAELEKGYAGLWIDDVNLAFRVSNGSGEQEAPIDPRTGQPMTEQHWEEYVVTFVEEIRAALPKAEILHNSIWYAGGSQRWHNPLVKREIAAANYINLERGVNDPGLTGGSGEWSLQALFSFIDNIHALGRGAILDGWDNSPQGREYSLASYYLISSGNDGLGNAEMTPENWWSAYETNLGTPEGPRAETQNVLRRNYTNGIALVNEPNSPTRTITLPAPMYTTEGNTTTTITLPPATGAVLRYVNPPGPTATAAAAVAHWSAARAPESGELAGSVVILHEHRLRGRRSVILYGRVLGGHAGIIVLTIARHTRHGWSRTAQVRLRLDRQGGFATRLRHLHFGRYKASAVYRPPLLARVASSARVSFGLAWRLHS